MPTLRRKKDKSKHYVLTSIAGQVITFQLTENGQKRFLGAGLKDGDGFDRAVLFDLYRAGDAFTHGSGTDYATEDSHQLLLDFPDDATPESIFPSCSKCGSPKGLNLVNCSNNPLHDSYILCPSCRATQTIGPDVSMPLPILSRSIIAQFQQMGQMLRPDARVALYINRLRD